MVASRVARLRVKPAARAAQRLASSSRAALYHRVSSADQNPNAARHELRAAARRMALRVVIDQRETGKGTNNDRPGLMRVLQAAQRGAVDVVLVWKLDRFGRSAFDLLGNTCGLPGTLSRRFSTSTA